MKDLELVANKIRNHVVDMTHNGNSSHVGSALSIVDILTVLYFKVLNHDPNQPDKRDRDRFILSKGHAGAAVYATLALSGYFSEKDLLLHYKNGSIFSGHISHKGIPGVEISTGSLGHGLGVGVGMALYAKKNKMRHQIFVLLSDGELDEGSNWEAFLFASHHKLNNITAIVDYNKLQSMKSVKETLNLEPLSEKFTSFGWNVETCNGHDHNKLITTLTSSKLSEIPTIIICNTTKGYGVSFMENSVLWHYRSPQGEEYLQAKKELKMNKNNTL